jgi:hypothetical protein
MVERQLTQKNLDGIRRFDSPDEGTVYERTVNQRDLYRYKVDIVLLQVRTASQRINTYVGQNRIDYRGGAAKRNSKIRSSSGET